MKGWPVTIYFDTQEQAQRAAYVIGPIVGELVKPSPLLDAPILRDIVETFGKPSKALAVGLKERQISRVRKTAWDR